ncbi:MAG: tyrosine-type recombinase/integrase [Actinobacteria bacterium]|nr:tyrosine-type recombinase/integrase [Actinomycetota bacterium]
MKRVIEIFRTREELEKLVNLPNKKYISGIRNRAILAVLCYAGLRVGEIISLRPSDVKENDSVIRVNNAKWKSSRMVYVPSYLFHYINKWLEVKPESKYLFCSRYGKKLLPDYLQKMVKRYAGKIDPDKNIHPHCLRHYVECYIMVSA